MGLSLTFGIVGCGLIGHKRARSLGQHRLVACADVILENAQRLAQQTPGCRPTADYRDILADDAVQAVVVCTPNQLLAPIALAVVQAGKHVLIEKPAARYAGELAPIASEARSRGVSAKIGYNHRFHPGFQRARSLVDSGEYGPVLYIRGRYGHGGRVGYENEWRADPRTSGGGELIDQGVHLIDLSRWFMGDFASIHGHLATYFWNMPVEDNAFVLLTTASGGTAFLHASWTEWKNLFSFEICCRDAKLQVDGLGGSYGTERLTLYRMLPEMGPPETTIWEYPHEDRSWSAEMENFAAAVAGQPSRCADVSDGLAVLEIVDALYKEAGRDYHA